MSGLNLAEAASMIADPSRAAIIQALMDGTMHPASDLAYMARITPQTASFHLAKMQKAGLVAMEQQGRHRYYRLAPEGAGLVEQLMQIAQPAPVRSLRESTRAATLKKARTCYDHFAGELGVQLTDAMLRLGVLDEAPEAFMLTLAGTEFFRNLGIDAEHVRQQRRAFASKCLDWSERRYHLAGALGHTLVERFQEQRWTERIDQTRAIRVTDIGRQALASHFHISASH